MKCPVRLILSLALVLVMLSNDLPVAGAQTWPLSGDQAQVVNAVSSVFEAAANDDLPRFHAAVAPGFYLYDAGVRVDGDRIMVLIKAEHAKGKKYQWNVTEPDVHVSGNTAWIAYVNRGSITDQSGTVPVKWLESAFLRKMGTTWRIEFMHSTRVPDTQPASTMSHTSATHTLGLTSRAR